MNEDCFVLFSEIVDKIIELNDLIMIMQDLLMKGMFDDEEEDRKE